VPVSIHAFDPSLIDDLREMGADHVIVPKHDGTRELARRLRDAGVLD
jgi:Trk K+ transport system NAD-binding subunit